MIQNKLTWLFCFLAIALAGCSLDNGYNPNPFDRDAKIDYVLDSSELPLCNDGLEGYVFLYYFSLGEYGEKVITCVEGEWIVLRSVEEDSHESDTLPHFVIPDRGMYR